MVGIGTVGFGRETLESFKLWSETEKNGQRGYWSVLMIDKALISIGLIRLAARELTNLRGEARQTGGITKAHITSGKVSTFFACFGLSGMQVKPLYANFLGYPNLQVASGIMHTLLSGDLSVRGLAESGPVFGFWEAEADGFDLATEEERTEPERARSARRIELRSACRGASGLTRRTTAAVSPASTPASQAARSRPTSPLHLCPKLSKVIPKCSATATSTAL